MRLSWWMVVKSVKRVVFWEIFKRFTPIKPSLSQKACKANWLLECSEAGSSRSSSSWTSSLVYSDFNNVKNGQSRRPSFWKWACRRVWISRTFGHLNGHGNVWRCEWVSSHMEGLFWHPKEVWQLFFVRLEGKCLT